MHSHLIAVRNRVLLLSITLSTIAAASARAQAPVTPTPVPPTVTTSPLPRAPVQSPIPVAACGAWESVPVQQAGLDPVLWAVDGVSPQDVWAVGAFYDPVADAQVQHWDGTAWTLVPHGGTDLPVSALRGVTAIAADDVWAVGLFNTVPDGSGPIQPLVEHWNGSAWTVVPAPAAGVNAMLLDVAAAAPDDVWAVGNWSEAGGDSKALIEHWDGRAWTTVPAPAVDVYHALNAVTVIASNDVWAVGRRNDGGVWHTLVEHWDGAQWTVVPSGTAGGILNAISAAGPDDIWAVGTSTTANTMLAMHWNGAEWQVVDSTGLSAIALNDVTVIAADDAWAVGTGPDIKPLTLHWDGQRWSAVPSVDGFTLHSVNSVLPGDVWAVGQTDTEAIAAHYTDVCQRAQP